MARNKNLRSKSTGTKTCTKNKVNTRNNSGSNFDISDRDEDKLYKCKGNDPQWYANEPRLLADSCSIPYSWPVGSTITRTNDVVTSGDVFSFESTIPGICTLSLITGPGVSTDNNSAVNIASRNIYSYVRHVNSGHSNYDHQDLMLYLLAVDEGYMWLYNAIRAYGAMSLTNLRNRYAPKYIVQALGWDYDDLMANLAQFRYAINAFIVRLGSLVVPNNLPIFERHKFIYSALLCDGTSAKAQLYAMKPAGYRVYSETSSSGGKLTYNKLSNTALLKVADFIIIAQQIINPIVGSEDMNIMSGDILKAYGANIVTLPQLSSDYSILPIYNEAILSQFQNAIIFKNPLDKTNDITQNPTLNEGTVLYQPKFQALATGTKLAAPLYSAQQFVNLNLDAPTPLDTMYATRLMNIPQFNSKDNAMYLESSTTEIPINGDMYRIKKSSSGVETLERTSFSSYSDFTQSPFSELGTIYWDNIFNGLSKISMFRFHPMINFTVNEGSAAEPKIKSFTDFELDNYTIINRPTLNNIHDTALFSLWKVPQMGRVSSSTK